MGDDTGLRDQVAAIYRVVAYNPAKTFGILTLSVFTALFEGVGLTLLLPIIEIVQSSGTPEPNSGIAFAFYRAFQFVGLPFSLESAIAVIGAVMVLRYGSSLVVDWFQAALRMEYVGYLRSRAFTSLLDARIGFFDEEGDDDLLNAVITQTSHAGTVITRLINVLKMGFLASTYFAIALFLSPVLTLGVAVFLGIFVFGLRKLIESGYTVGDRVADANERVQRAVQAGIQGIREVKLFGMRERVRADFDAGLDQFVSSKVARKRNQAVLNNVYRLAISLALFGIVYVALTFTPVTLAALGVFLFALYRMSPLVSNINSLLYVLQSDLPHLVRTQRLIDELQARTDEERGGGQSLDAIDEVRFDEVTFAYEDEAVLRECSFAFERGEFIAFVGPSGTGKSTIVSLLTRFYRPDVGDIYANGRPIDEYDLDEWRSRISVVQQNPHLFNESLRANLTIGNPDATDSEIEEACEIAEVVEFLDELPDGYDTVLGDDGVRLSGGQRQRVAIARALLKESDLLVLDEATSELDTSLEQSVHEGIETMDRDFAMLVIAHRLSTVTNADRIYAMERGRISEVGPHEDLMENEGTYAELYAKQTFSA